LDALDLVRAAHQGQALVHPSKGREKNMAIIELDPAFKTVYGGLGNSVLRRTPSGKTSLIKRADMSNVEWSEAQGKHRRRFKQATAYARAAMAEPSVCEQYRKMAAKRKKRAFNLAVSDYFKGIELLKKSMV
jgi:hypothetical protein